MENTAALDELLGGFGKSGRIIWTMSTSDTGLNDANCEIVRKISEAGNRTIVITLNNPSPLIKDMYKEQGIDISKVYFIDAITKYALGCLPDDLDNAVFISNPANLTDVGIALTEMLKENPNEKTCIIIDSINTMMIYISTPVLTKFIHFLSSKLKLMRCFAFYLAINDAIDPMLLNQLTTFADQNLDV